MTQDIRQWLAEIKALQQKLAEVQQERDQAYISAANWRNLYETEAKQRRADLQAAQDTIAALQVELAAQQRPTPDASNYGAILHQQVEQWQTPEELKAHLMQALLDCDRLVQELEAERQAHTQTRQDLTTALGDTMDLLAKARARKQERSATVIPLHRGNEPAQTAAKGPLHEPQPPDPVQFPS
ncbi:MAG: hypothetical protein EDM05_034310 [Leptolyngbya sp. IPPAS B-1204]|nr:hypothetical protein [Elainella sp. C42_A2020_010]